MTGTNADMDAVIRALAVLDAEPDNRDALAILDEASKHRNGQNGQAQAAGGGGAPAQALQAVADARRVHRERGDFELVAKLLDCELAWLPTDAKPDRQADLLVERGKLFADELLDDAEAQKSFERVLQLRPGDSAAEETLSHISLVRDNWQKIVKKYLEEAKESTDRALTTSLYLSVAELYAKYGGPPENKKQVEVYLKQALEVEPRNMKASMRLERLYLRDASWEPLRALYEARIEAAPTKEERVAAYLALADVLARRLQQANEAAEAYKKALGIDPGNQRALSALVEHYTGVENWQALIRVYENALRVRPRGDAKAPSGIDLSETAMLLQIAMLWWKKLGNLEAADEYWKRVRKSEPAHPAMLDFYRDYHAKEPGKLLPILQQAQKLEPDAKRRLDLATEMARLSEKVPGGTEKAIDLWKSVLKQDPRADQAGEALQRLYQQTEKWNALLELLKERMEALPKEAVDERVARLLEVVAIYRDRLNLDVMVINTYNHILQLRPDHPVALAALAQKYETMGRWNDLIGVLQRTADASTDNVERARLLKRIAGLWLDKFSNVNQAVKPLEELYALDPADPDTVARLRDIYGRRRAWRSLVDLERKELERLKPADGAPPEAREAFRQKAIEIAKLAAERLGDPKEAIVLWNRLLELDENDADALTALGALYEREKRWAPLVEVLRRQVEKGTGDAKRDLQLLERIGALWIDRLQAPEQAIRAWQEILKRNPSHPKAMRTLRELYAQGGRYDDLERLYGEQNQWEELCDVLLGVVERMGDATKEGGDADDVKATRVKLCLRVATLAVEKLNSTDRAAKAYERVLAIDPHHAGAARALVPIYRGGEKWARLLASYEILLSHVAQGAAGDDEKLALIDEVVRLCEDKLGSKGLAFTWAARAYAVRPTDERRGAELERLAADAEAWDELAEIYAGEVTAAGEGANDARTIDRMRKLGRIARERQHLPSEARKWFERILALRPDDEEALATLESLFTQGEQFVELLGIYRRRADGAVGADVGKRLDLLFKIAWIEEEKLTQLDAAVATLRRIVELASKANARAAHERALRGLEKLHRDRADWRALTEVLEQQKALAAGDVDAQVALEVQLGELFAERLNDRDAALSRYKAAFALSPSHRPTQVALERWLEPGPGSNVAARTEVAALLAPLYEQRGDQGRLVGALEVLLAATPSEDRARRLTLARRLSSLLVPPGGASELDPGSDRARRAYDHSIAIFGLEPTDATNRQLLADLAERLECPDDLAVRLGAAEKAAADANNVELARDLAWDLGRLFADRLGMPDDAEEAYRRVLARDPAHSGADIALVTLLSSNEKWPALRGWLADKAKRAMSPADKVSLLFRVAELDEGVLGNDDAAIADYLELLAIDPAGTQAVAAARALDRLYTQKEKWRELDALLEGRVPYAPATVEGASSTETRGHLLARRGELAMTRLDQPARAAELFEQAIDDDPKHEVARRGLETLMKRPELRQRIARALEPLYIREEAWPKLALVLGAQREAPELRDLKDPARAAEALTLAVRLADLQEQRLGARQLALATWREALRIAPSEAKVRENVERLCTLLSRPADLAAAWEEALLVSDPADLTLRAELLEKAAEIYEHDLRDRDRAKQAWRRLLELDPTNIQTSRPAALALARLYEAEESWPGLIEVLHRQADWADAPGEKKELLFRIGRIQEELTVDPKAAVATYREILEVDPEERGALDALERLHNAEGRWPELVDILKRRLDLERDGTARRDLAWRLAQIAERELKDATQAIAWYHAILDERPDDLPALDALARLFEAANRTVDLLDVLERQLVIVDGKETARGASSAFMPQRVALRMRVGTLQSQLGRREQALERFREVLDEDHRHEGARAGLEALTSDPDLRLRAAEVLEPAYERAGELDKLIKISELFAEHAPDPRERISRLRKISELQKGAKSAGGSFDALSRAARYAVGEPDLPDLLIGLERVAAEAGRRPELVALYREIGPDILDATTQERVYLTIAAESHRLGDRPTAREYYRRVLDSSPEHPRALDALENIYLEQRELEPLFEIYVRRAELFGQAGDAEKQRHYLISLASLCEGELTRPTEAIRAWEQVLELFPADVDAAKALEAHYTAEKRWVDLAELVEKRLGFADDLDEAVALRFRLAQIYDHELRDSDRAVENYRAALGGDPAHAGAITALERYLDDETQRVSAAEVLEPVYSGRHEWQKLARIYEIRLQAADDPRVRLGLVRRIARLYEEQLEDLDGSFRWYSQLFREDPADRNVRDQLARLAGVLGSWEQLAKVYEEWLRDSVDEALNAEVLRALASIYHTRINDVDGAKSAYVRLLSIDNADELAFVNLEKLLTGAGRWKDLIEVWRDAADATLDMDRRKALLFKQAHVEETELGSPEAAVDRYRAVLDVDQEDSRAIGALDRLYIAGKRWHDLVELIQRRLERADGPGWIALKLRLGGLYEAELEDRASAIDAYEEVLTRSPGHPDGVRALERLIVDNDHTFRIAQILEPIYREQDAWQKLVVIYDAELEYIDDKPRRIELLREIARIHETRGGDRRLGFQALARALGELVKESGSVDEEAEIYADLERLARAEGNWGDLVNAVHSAIEGSYDAELLARMHARVARIRDAELKDINGAVDSWRKVVAARDDEGEAWRALERLLEAAGRAEELVVVLEKRATLEDDAGAQKELLARAAALYDGKLGQPEQAIAAWRQVLTIDDGEPRALDALERLYAARGAHRDLSAIYSRKVELAVDDSERRRLRLLLAKLAERELKDTFAAIDALKGILEANASDREALSELARLYEGEGLWADHLEALDALGQSTEVPLEERIEVAFRAAIVVEQKMAEAEPAIRRYAEVLQAIPARIGGAFHAGARAALERLVREADTMAAAAAVLEPFYQARAEYAPLVEVTELRLQAENDPSERRQLFARLAELNEAGLEDLQGAFAAWGRALAEEAGDAAVQGELERLAEVGQAFAELARLYEERLAGSFDPDVQRVLAWKLGVLYETRLGDDERAIAAYRKALELAGGPIGFDDVDGGAGSDRACLSALDRLLLRGSRWRDLAEVLEREAQAVVDPAAQAELYHRLGAVRAGELVDLDGALAAFREALTREPSHAAARAGLEALTRSPIHAEAALDVLEPLYEDDGDHRKLLQLTEIRLGITENRSDQVALLERMAERALEKLGDAAGALQAMGRALQTDPTESRLADEVTRLADAAGDELAAAAIFDDVLAGPSRGGPGLVPEVERELALRSGRLYERHRDGRAEERYRTVLEAGGGGGPGEAERGEALTALERIYRGVGDGAKLVEILERRADVELDVSEKKRLLTEAAQLRQAGGSDEAVEAWRKVLAVDEADATALDALAALHEAAGRWRELVEVLEERARFSESPAEQAQLKGRLGQLYAERLEELERAAQAFRDLVDLQPESLPALEALEQVERRRGDHVAVQEVLVRRLQAVGAGAAQIPVYLQLADLAMSTTGKDASPEDAIGYLHEVLTIAPGHEQATARLLGLLEENGKYHDLVDVLTQEANRRGQAGDAAGEVALLVRVADVWEGKLGSPESATEILERILARDPSSVRALASLARIYESAGESDKCLETLERALPLAKSGEEQAELHFRIGRLAANDPDRGGEAAAEQAYRRALAAWPQHKGAREGLEAIARSRGAWDEVVELLRLREAEVAGDEAAARALYVEVAQLLLSKLGRANDALPWLEKARALAPDEPTVLEPLGDLYFASGRLDDALPIYRALAERMQKARKMKDVARLRGRIGAIAEARGDLKLATEEYTAALQIDPAHAATMAALGRLYMAASEWEKARGLYRKMLLQNLDPQGGVTKADVYLALGEIHEKLNEGPKAIGMYERGLEVDAGHEKLRAAIARLRKG